MKKPKELLFARHHGIVPKLDDIRHDVISGLDQSGQNMEQARKSWFAEFWMEVIWPCRRIWTTLCAIWILLFIVNVSQKEDSPALIARSRQVSEMMLALQLEERRFNDLLADRPRSMDPNPSKPSLPKPRTEISGIIKG